MPGYLADAFLEMLPQLEAEAALAQVHILQLGGGLMDRSEGQRALRRLRRQAGFVEPVMRPSAQEIADMGIQIKQG